MSITLEFMAHPLEQISKHTITKRIQYLESVDLNSLPYEQVEILLKELMKGYSFLTRKAKTSPAYRIRKNNGTALFTNTSELSYPPAKFIQKDGRVNRAGESIFYCAESEAIAMSEVRAVPGNILTISECILNKENLFFSEIGLPEFFGEQINKGSGINLLENIKAGIKHFGDRITLEKNLLIRSFLARQFVKIVESGNEHEYKITNSISRILLESERFEGLMYPSVAGNHKGTNIAVKPKVADSFYSFNRVWVNLVEKIVGQNLFEVKRLSTAVKIDSCGTIYWSNNITEYFR